MHLSTKYDDVPCFENKGSFSTGTKKPQGTYIYTYLTTPLHEQDVTQGQFYVGFNRFEFSFPSRLVTIPRLLLYLPINGGRIIGFISFTRVFALCEMQTVSSKIWTRVIMSISFDGNHYITSTSLPSQLGLLNTPTASLQRGKTPPPQRVSWIWH